MREAKNGANEAPSWPTGGGLLWLFLGHNLFVAFTQIELTRLNKSKNLQCLPPVTALLSRLMPVRWRRGGAIPS